MEDMLGASRQPGSVPGTLPIPPTADVEWISGPRLSDEVVKECADLFSQHYGFWGRGGKRPGEPICLSPSRIRELLSEPESWIALARKGPELIGYAIAARLRLPNLGIVTWVTQLVVHRDHRRNGVAKRLLTSIWSFSDHYAWGLVTANPFAVRALEKATRRRCDPLVIHLLGSDVIEFGRQQIRYVAEAQPYLDDARSVLDTHFRVSHKGLAEMLRAVQKNVPWALGSIKSSEEWFAFTFREQDEFPLQSGELDMLLADADSIARRAFAGMTLGEDHRWAQHTETELDYIIKELGITPGARVLDLGCGMGRHSIALAKRGFNVVGVDFVESHITRAIEVAEKEEIENVKFIVGDARSISLGELFDAVICLYDVVGTFPHDAENQEIVNTLVRHLEPGAGAAISVMNFTPTWNEAKYKVDLHRNPGALLSLLPSSTMQDSGQIFNSDYYLVDTETRLVYRKEQFDKADDQLPCELIVRDRRYTLDEMVSMCVNAGLNTAICKPVRAGNWGAEPLEESNNRAKEILYLGFRPSE